MKKITTENSHRRNFFTIIGISAISAVVMKAMPLTNFISNKTSAPKIKNAKVIVHPKAIARNNRGLS